MSPRGNGSDLSFYNERKYYYRIDFVQNREGFFYFFIIFNPGLPCLRAELLAMGVSG